MSSRGKRPRKHQTAASSSEASTGGPRWAVNNINDNHAVAGLMCFPYLLYDNGRRLITTNFNDILRSMKVSLLHFDQDNESMPN